MTARDSGFQRSALVPAPTTSGGLAKIPARRRQATRPPKVWAHPAPKIKRAKIGSEIKYVAVLPNLSLNGAARTGPKAKPRRNNEKGSRAAVSDTSKTSITCGTAEV